MSSRTFKSLCEVLIAFSATGALAARIAVADEYQLVVDGQPALTSSATLVGDALTITDSSGRTFQYQRQKRFDTPNGKYAGFYSNDSRMALRWPTNGSGAMLLGGVDGAAWRASQQQVQAVAATVAPGANFRGDGTVAAIPISANECLAAYIDDQGVLRGFTASVDSRRPTPISTDAKLVPRGGVALWRPREDIVAAISIDVDGALVRILPDETSSLNPSSRFVPGSALSVSGDIAFAVDQRGRLLQIGLQRRGVESAIESREGVLPPGAPVAVAADAVRGAPNVFVVDRQGNLLAYSSSSSTTPPEIVATGFPPGSHIAIETRPTRVPNSDVRLVAVDWTGQLQILRRGAGEWVSDAPVGTRLPPGATIVLADTVSGSLLMAINQMGQWQSWMLGPPTITSTIISTGFPVGGVVTYDPYTGLALAIDQLGHLAIANLVGNDWVTYLAWPEIDFTPKLLSREVVPNPTLGVAEVSFENSSDDELVLQVVDKFDPRQPPEYKVPARSAVQIAFERDAGSVLEERYLVPGPVGTLIEEVHSYPIPPQQRYDVVAWSNRVQYRYIDRKKNKPPGALANFDIKRHASLGVIPIPPGELLRDAEVINVQEAAQALRNPGAAVWYPRPQAKDEVIQTSPGTPP